MPVLYILAASIAQRANPPYNKTIDNSICQMGGLNGIRAGMMMGEENGINDAQSARLPSGWPSTFISNTKEIMMGSMTGNVSDCESVSSPPAAPMAAKSEPYSRKPPKKNMMKMTMSGPK